MKPSSLGGDPYHTSCAQPRCFVRGLLRVGAWVKHWSLWLLFALICVGIWLEASSLPGEPEQEWRLRAEAEHRAWCAETCDALGGATLRHLHSRRWWGLGCGYTVLACRCGVGKADKRRILTVPRR